MICLLLMMAGATEPSTHTILHYNARMALREHKPIETVKLWLLRNALEAETHTVSSGDADFHSVTWAALGDMGVCPDGHPDDDDGAGLWPLALHNWVLRNRTRRGVTKRPRPFDAFQIGRQSRFVAIADVLSGKELQTVRFFRGRCIRQTLALVSSGQLPTAKLSDRRVAAELLRHLLRTSNSTLSENVRGRAVVEARLFDVNLQIMELAAMEARRKARGEANKGRGLGLTRETATAIQEEAPSHLLDPESEAAQILQVSVRWPVSEWMAISAERRRFIYHHAWTYGVDPVLLDGIALGIIDALIEAGEGAELERWIGIRVGPTDTTGRQLLWDGDRGRRLLALDTENGFRERSVIALHRGVHTLQAGDLPGALRAFGLALQLAPESAASEETTALALRWLSYVAAQFVITDELLLTLRELVPRREYALLLEDLMWRAALRADKTSFERGERNQAGRGALERRLELLRPLAGGDVGRFTTMLRKGLEDSPSETLRFLSSFADRLEREDAGVRTDQLRTLEQLRAILLPLASDEQAGRRARSADELRGRFQAIIEGLDQLELVTERDRARSVNPGEEVFAGSVRLAPSDALPWPFREPDVAAPSVFTPIPLTPIEWFDEDGELVLGWTLSEP